MTKHQTIKLIRSELNGLNRLIDVKIIKGVPYKDESRRHKLLLRKLKYVAHNRSLFGQSMGFLSTLVS
jgi:hypothetical protein